MAFDLHLHSGARAAEGDRGESFELFVKSNRRSWDRQES
jgi:hypothetical protein